MRKSFIRSGLAIFAILVLLSAAGNASNGQIRESEAWYGSQLCVQTFICTSAGWVPFSDPVWFTPW